MQSGDLLVESLESSPGDGLPFADVRSVEDSGDVFQGKPGILEHAYEDELSEGRNAVSALSGSSGIGDEQAEAFVVADRRRGNVGSFGHLPDRKQWLRHVPLDLKPGSTVKVRCGRTAGPPNHHADYPGFAGSLAYRRAQHGLRS